MAPHAPRKRGIKRLAVAGIALATAVVLAACSGTGSGSGSTNAAGLTTMNYQLSWLKLTQFGGYFAAEKQGFYTDEHIAPTFTAGGSNILAWQQVVTGKAQLGDEDNTNALVAIGKGQPLVIIGSIFQTSPFAIMSLESKPINSIQDFAGKTIAVPDAALAQFKALVSQAGIPDGKVNFISAGTDPTQLTTGQADGYAGYATSQGASLQIKGIKIHSLYLEDLGVPSYGNVIVTTKDEIKNHRTDLVNFLKASIKGYEYMNANPQQIADYVVTTVNPAGGLDQKTEEQTAVVQKTLIESPKGVLWVNADKMQKIIDSLVAAGTLKSSIKASDIVDTSLLTDAYGGKTSLLP